jgi:hypothetical protein
LNTNEGAVYLFLGPLSGTLSVGAAQAEILGTTTTTAHQAGFQVDGLGDLNNDGYDDIGVTTQNGSYLNTGYRGVHIFLGPINGTVQMEFADAIIANPPGSSTLYEPTVAGAGDIDGDGLGDLIIAFGESAPLSGTTTYGGARVVYGPFGGDMDLFGAGTEPLGDEGTSSSTYLRACAGRTADLDGDGLPDPVVLRPSSSNSEITSVRVYVNPHDP